MTTWVVQPTEGTNNQWKCPECGNTTKFRVEITETPMADITVNESGEIVAEITDASFGWGQDAYAVCGNENCNHASIVDTFKPER